MTKNAKVTTLCALMLLTVASCYYWFTMMPLVVVRIPIYRGLDSSAKLDVVPLTENDYIITVNLIADAKRDLKKWRDLDELTKSFRIRPNTRHFPIAEGNVSFRQATGPALLFVGDKGCGYYRAVIVGKKGIEIEINRNNMISEF